MSLSFEIIYMIDLDGAKNFPITIPTDGPYILEYANIMPGATKAKATVNYTTIRLFDCGAGGTEDVEVAIVRNSNKTLDLAAVDKAFTANVKAAMCMRYNQNTPCVLSGNGLKIVKQDNAAAQDLKESVLTLKLRTY